ncbi:alpha/beta hydrolase [Clostridium oryzae]|uniref:Acetylxylan esterase n=1 Tax=Clostridium oryzae TaxID=1450648 RepID=A0A1V4IQL1_9CLOT|nr:alpha/beta hydrolase [Clostridium oryzae]OPJ62100.1 acetylxylan esterase precursor [Clostridium oryzae]
MISKRINLWNEENYDKQTDGFKPYMDTYVLYGNKKRPAVVICPGGAYAFTSDREAEAIALKFNAAGFHAFIVYYSVAPRKHPQPILDVSRAMCIVRENAEKWNVDSNKIAICGFSAGGHLAASLSVYWEKDYISKHVQITQGLNRPNAAILCYPVITSGEFAHEDSFKNLLGNKLSKSTIEEMSLEKHVNEKVPPTFIWHTYADELVPVENSLLFARALKSKEIPFELHIYPDGVHGLSLATEETAYDGYGQNPHVATWMKLCIEWLIEVFR